MDLKLVEKKTVQKMEKRMDIQRNLKLVATKAVKLVAIKAVKLVKMKAVRLGMQRDKTRVQRMVVQKVLR